MDRGEAKIDRSIDSLGDLQTFFLRDLRTDSHGMCSLLPRLSVLSVPSANTSVPKRISIPPFDRPLLPGLSKCFSAGGYIRSASKGQIFPISLLSTSIYHANYLCPSITLHSVLSRSIIETPACHRSFNVYSLKSFNGRVACSYLGGSFCRFPM